MPIGAFKLNGIGKATVTVVAQVLRGKKGMTAVGNTQISTAQSKFGGSSALFDTSADWLTATHTGDLNFGSSDFTVEFWMRPVTRASSYPQVYQNAPFAAGAINITDRHNANTSKLNIWVVNYSNSTPFMNSTTTIVDNTWYHIALVRSGSSWKLFVNGTSEATATYAGDATSGTTSTVTAFANDIANSSVTQWNGYLDEIRISKTARYSANFTPSTTPFTNDSNTLLLIHCDGTNASTFFDDDNGTGRSAKGIQALGNAQVSTAQSKFGGSSYLGDGTGDSLTVSSNGSFGFTGDFTIEGWVRFTNFTNTPIIIDTRSSTDGNVVKPTLYFSTSGVPTYYTNGSVRITGSALSTAIWYHFAISRSGTSTKLFIDGTQVGSTYTDSNSYVDSNLSIGGYLGNGSYSLNGYMDEVRVSNIARYTANFTPSTTAFVNDSNTLLLLHCDGTNASTVFRDDNGTGRSQNWFVVLGNTQISTAQSKFGGSSGLFDATNDYLQTPNPISGTGNFTIEFWVRRNTVSVQRVILDFRNSSYLINMAIYWTSDNKLNLYANSANRIASVDTYTSTTTWYHVALVRSTGVTKMYVDGTQVGSDYADTNNYSNIPGLTIGAAYDGSGAIDSYLDEIRISNNARYTGTFTPSTTPFQNDSNTLLLMHMDGTNASTVFTDDNGVYPA